LKIERQSDEKTTTIRVIGRIRAEDLEELKAQMGDCSERIIFNLSEVTIVNADVIRFLSAGEGEGTRLVSCPPYVREWILRERAEGGT
jgi:anti-anti-sigma regulatory factor